MNLRLGLAALLAAVAMTLVGCGGGSSGASAFPDGGSTGGGGATPPEAVTPTVNLSASDPSTGAGTNALIYGKPARLRAQVLDQNGKIVPGAIVTFAAEPANLVALSQVNVLTNSQGVAEIQVSANIISSPDAVALTASAAVSGNAATSLPVNMSVGSTTSTGNIGAPAVLQYVSTVPTRLVIKGASEGAAGAVSETATVTFKVLDASGNVVPNAPVLFDLSTRNGGLTTNGQSTAVQVSSNTLGVATVTVGSGTAPESFYVFASLPTSATPSQRYFANDQIAVSSGLPDQRYFALFHVAGSACADATKPLVYPCGMTINVGDYLGHPAPDGTIVSFATTEAGLVVGDSDSNTNATGYCLTKGGQCTVQVWGGARGTNEVVAFAIGQGAAANSPVVVLSRNGGTRTIIAAPASDDYVRDTILW